jgi:hypothetical protein
MAGNLHQIPLWRSEFSSLHAVRTRTHSLELLLPTWRPSFLAVGHITASSSSSGNNTMTATTLLRGSRLLQRSLLVAPSTSIRSGGWNVASSRTISSSAARALLGLPTSTTTSANKASSSSTDPSPLTLTELRHAYFAAAKRCHPDMKKKGDHDNNDDDENHIKNGETTASAVDFLQVTHAYEILQREITNTQDELAAITSSEEEEFRNACQSWLGMKAEIVEECKKNPIFRQWLSGRTDAAYHWRAFFQQNGGLAPKLRPSGGQLAAGDTASAPSHTTRRKRVK